MKKINQAAIMIAVLTATAHASAQVTFYEDPGFQGRSFSSGKTINDLERFGFNDRASSVTVAGERWEVCEDARFRGKCVVLRPGKYPTASAMGLNNRISSMRAIKKNQYIANNRYAPALMPSQITFYENERFGGRSFSTENLVDNFRSKGFNDRVSSVTVTGPDSWQACEDTRFNGRCVILRPGQYPSLREAGLDNRISSVRNSATPAAAPAASQITFFENERFGGRSFSVNQQVENFASEGFNDRVSSITVTGPDQWEACEDARFNGRCVTLAPGQYPSLRGTALNDRILSVRNARTRAPVTVAPSSAKITFFENENFSGRSFTTEKLVDNLTNQGFNDRASSVLVAGDTRWEVCDDARFNGRCMVLRPGHYTSLQAMGLNNRISSVREVSRDARIDERRYAPLAPDYSQRQDERLYQANVTSVRAVVGTPEKRCWVERAQVPQDQSSANIPGAVVGALLGGILGHQVGGGTGKDVATAGGAIAGAVLGSKVGGGNATAPQGATQDVQRCEETPSQARTEYWDVTYNFKGQDHRIQMTSPSGRTLAVNEQGEPRS